MLLCDHVDSLEDLKFWQVVTQNCTLRSKKVLIALDKPELNRNEKSVPVYLF